ncbi:hypothetical protein PM082_004262 [Marasmius tenuissimus]|nr:hypothetical protein PM082_004262 [Marasmius tenuissimus]
MPRHTPDNPRSGALLLQVRRSLSIGQPLLIDLQGTLPGPFILISEEGMSFLEYFH